jgi:hypothetical protein
MRAPRTVPGWFRLVEHNFRHEYPAAVALDVMGEAMSERMASVVWTAAEMEVEGLVEQARGARRILEEFGLGMFLERAIGQLKRRDIPRNLDEDDDEVTEVTGIRKAGGVS